MKKLFGTDGVRGIAGEFLTHSLAQSIGYALGRILKSKKGDEIRVIIGTDTRESRTFLKEALARGLTLSNAAAYDVGVVSTPAVAYLTKKHGYDAGVMISASHNSYEYNGIKIFGSDGFKLTDEEEEAIESIIFSNDTKEVNEARLVTKNELKNEYVDYLKGYLEYDLSGIRAVIDCANGSATSTAKEIFATSGLSAEYIGCEPDGININRDCGSTHLSMLRKKVLESSADIGIAFDGDADRFLAIDENGNEIDGDFILAILSLAMRQKGRLSSDTVVGTVMSNYGFTKFASDNSLNFIATKVGDRYVLEEMEKNGYSLGGEQSGHVIIREAATTGDGQLTAIYLLNRMAEEKKPLSELASIMKKYPQHMVNVHADENEKRAFKENALIKEVISDAERKLGESGRILVRPSGTEPVVRSMVESKESDAAISVCEAVAEKIRAILA